MTAVLYAHIPGLKIEEAQVPFAGGQLKRVPFDEWIALESEFEYTDRKYERAGPVFWICDLPLGAEATEEEIKRSAYDAVWPVHTSFLLDNGAPLIPTPALSCCYLVILPPPELSDTFIRSVRRFIGPMEREFIVWGSPLTYSYTAEDLASVDKVRHLIEVSGIRASSDEVRAGIDVLEETARPDSWYQGDMIFSQLHGFVRCVAAAESILLSPKEGADGEKTQIFGRHAAALFGLSREDRERAAKHFSDLYRFRSDLMHGRSMPDEKDPAVAAKLHEGRQLLRNAACAALTLLTAMSDRVPLARRLEESWIEPERERELAAILSKGMHT
jgi:hypothetical protein